MKMYALTRSDGGISIHRDKTERTPIAEQIAKLVLHWAANVDPAKRWTVTAHVEITDVPTARSFRNAWGITGTDVSVDMPKARVIHMGRIRGARDVELVKTDAEYVAADSRGNPTERNAVIAKKLALRDLPANTDLERFTDAAALDAFWPTQLPVRQTI
jgi:hypothetical protein